MIAYCGKEGHDKEDKSDPDLRLREGRVVALELKTHNMIRRFVESTKHRCVVNLKARTNTQTNVL